MSSTLHFRRSAPKHLRRTDVGGTYYRRFYNVLDADNNVVACATSRAQAERIASLPVEDIVAIAKALKS